jgi:hypothetical protein
VEAFNRGVSLQHGATMSSTPLSPQLKDGKSMIIEEEDVELVVAAKNLYLTR